MCIIQVWMESLFFLLFVFLFPAIPRRVGCRLAIRATECMGLPGSDSKQGWKMGTVIKSLTCRDAELSIRALAQTALVNCILFHLTMYFMAFICWWGGIALCFLSKTSITGHPRNTHPPAMQRKTFHLLMAELLPSAKSPFHQSACEHF